MSILSDPINVGSCVSCEDTAVKIPSWLRSPNLEFFREGILNISLNSL